MLFKPEDHADNPPSTWKVEKAAPRLWHLLTKDGGVMEGFPTKREAEAHRSAGFLVELYDQERRWYAGERIAGLRPWADVKAENERREARNLARRAAQAAT